MKENKMQIAKEGIKALNELEEQIQLEEIIKDNRIEFKLDNKTFRIKKPNIEMQQKVGAYRRKKYIEFVSDDTYLFRKQWIEKYKAKGIDIEKMEHKINELQSEIKNLLLKLAQTKDPKAIKELKAEITKLREEQFKVNIEKTDYLAHSIEEQLTIQINLYSIFLMLEVNQNNEWVRYFKTYKDFENSDDNVLINKAIYYSNMLIYSDLENKDES